MLSPEELKTSAYHEAGHIVIAWHYGRHVKGASISDDDKKRGKSNIIRLFGEIPNIQAHELEREMDIAMAGIAAEEQLAGRQNIKPDWGGTDYPDAVEVANEWAKKTGEQFNNDYLIDQSIEVDEIKGIFSQQNFFDEFGGNVREMMSRPHIWKCVETVTNALLKHRELNGDEISSIISKAWEEADGENNDDLIKEQKQQAKERP